MLGQYQCYCCPPTISTGSHCTGQKGLVARAGSEGNSASLEIWGHGRVLKQLNVPKALHGPLYNDGWFASGAAWSPDEHRVAYCAEVCWLIQGAFHQHASRTEKLLCCRLIACRLQLYAHS